MISMNSYYRRFQVWICLCAACTLGPSAQGAIIDIDAAVSTTVQELIDGAPGSVTSDAEQLDGGFSDLPLLASGDLVSTDLEGVLVSMGQAFSGLEDPTRLKQPNPEEFGVEVECYSNADSVSYSVISSASESRTVVFTTAGSSLAPPEIDFGLGSRRTVESRVFLSGAIIFWSTDAELSLDDMLGELTVTVTRDDTGAVLFETALTVAGDGVENVEPVSSGPIRFDILEVEDLTQEGLDQETVAALEELAGTGTLVIIAIPQQEHAYTYTVTADQPLVITATMSTRARNIPGGTGVAATFGRPFENLADFIEQGLDGIDGAGIERSINAKSARSIGLVESQDPSTSRPQRLCGMLGLESAALLALSLVALVARPRR